MAFEISPYPEFSWSISRQRLFEQCPRAYYYRYYMSWNGWLWEAPGESRLAYRLSKLTSLDALLGQEMDVRAREIEAAARAGQDLPSQDDLEARTRAALNRAWVSSRERSGFERSPNKVTMLRSVYLGEDTEAEVARVREKISPCTHNLLAVPHWERIASCGKEGCVPIPDFAQFLLGEVKVFAAADLAFVRDGALHVIDWESGREEGDNQVQVLLSAYCLRENDLSLADLAIEGHVHYLATGEALKVTVPDDLAEVVRSVVGEGVALMRGYLLHPEHNVPLGRQDFERRQSGLCRSCNFAPLCEQANQTSLASAILPPPRSS